MSPIESLIFLIGAAALLAQLARALKVPYPVFLVLGGLLIGFVPGLPTVEISPEVIFLVFLPPLLNYAAFFSSPRDLRQHLRPLLALAIGLVLFTTATIALIAHTLIGLPWPVAFVLGAILAPTDPVAAEAIFRRLGVPGRVSTIVGGESLVNDGTGLVAYRVAFAGTRFLWFFTTPYLHPVFDRLLRNRYLAAPWQERLVMVWSGMRGDLPGSSPRRTLSRGHRRCVPRSRANPHTHLLGYPRYAGPAGADFGSLNRLAQVGGRRRSRHVRGVEGPARGSTCSPRAARTASQGRIGLAER
jgi:NhaP-type Na+/H+ or K+/H+ antiporter